MDVLEGLHERILADIERISERTGIHPNFIRRSMAEWCEEREVDWVRHLRKHLDEGERTGLAYIGLIDRVTDRMQAIAGACIRNLIEARVVPLESLHDYDHSTVGVLLIPDFYTGELAGWKRTKLLSLLIERHAGRKATVIYVSSSDCMREDYGEALYQHVKTTSHVLKGAAI